MRKWGGARSPEALGQAVYGFTLDNLLPDIDFLALGPPFRNNVVTGVS
ncbi:MAG: hypothetical protein ACYC7E_03745 [Armatimonadota bacterium]